MSIPAGASIYHITHVNNLPAILQAGGLRSDASMIQMGGPRAGIGMSKIKQRRLRLPVLCWPGHHVGDFVPFYFCPRSVMLFVIHCQNHQDLAYRGGQEPIVHLKADLNAVIQWATAHGRRWAFSLSNAGAAYTEYRNTTADFGLLNWLAIATTDFRQPAVKEAKQAEFLLHDWFPWQLVSYVGAYSDPVATQARTAIARAAHRPPVAVEKSWYY